MHGAISMELASGAIDIVVSKSLKNIQIGSSISAMQELKISLPQVTTSKIVSKLHMLNTQFALVLPGVVTAFGTYLCKQGYQSLPRSLEEAAEIDGANVGQRFLFVMLPLTRSSLVSLGVFTALFAYKDLMWPLIVNTDINMMTLSSGLATLRGQFSTNFPVMMAGSLLAMIPMVVLYLFFQKQFIEGVAMTGGK